ncbi:MAG TPA: hypothetical protein VMV32_05315 [Ignavibacteriaceae bacterium]|nr:hypothetical protein [Ignavibacteriaceae bacterium]
MKKRSGFVSNSSSSSFVIVGYPVNKIVKEEDKENIIRKHAPQILESDSFKKWGIDEAWTDFLDTSGILGDEGLAHISDDGPGYIGLVLADVSDDGGYLDHNEISLEDALLKVNKLREIFDIKESPSIIIGTRSC